MEQRLIEIEVDWNKPVRICSDGASLYVINGTCLCIMSSGEAVKLEFDSTLTAIDLTRTLIILGDDEGFVCILDKQQPLAECLFGPKRVLNQSITSIHGNCIVSHGGACFFDPIDYSWSDLELGSIKDAIILDGFSGWPLAMIDPSRKNDSPHCLHVGSEISISRVAKGPSLARMATAAISLFSRSPVADMIEKSSRACTLVEKLGDNGRTIHRLTRLSDQFIAMFDDKKGHILLFDITHFLWLRLFKGCRDASCLLHAGCLFILARKRNLVQKLSARDWSVVDEYHFEEPQQLVDMFVQNDFVMLLLRRDDSIYKMPI